jgi:outer membrane protein, heavy metal efflux system
MTLADAEKLLLERNLAITAGRQQVEIAEALRKIAGYKPNPQLDIGAEQLPMISPVPGSAPRLFSTNPDAGANPVYTLRFDKTFERGGKRELRTEQASAIVDAIKLQILDTFRTQLFALRQAFGAGLLARENLTIAESVDSQYDETEKLTEIRVHAGEVAEIDLQRIRVARLPFRQAVLDARTAYQQAIRDVLNLLNAPPEEIAVFPLTEQNSGSPFAIELSGKFNERPVALTLQQLREIALAGRPDIGALRANGKAAETSTRLAAAQRVRDIGAAVEYQRVGNDHSIGVTASIPLFIYNDQKAAISQATAQHRLVITQTRIVEQQALADVDKAYQAMLAARIGLSLYSVDNLKLVQSVRAIVEYSYKRGEASLLDLLDAQRTSGQAAAAYNQARLNYQLALWQLEAAIGRPLD